MRRMKALFVTAAVLLAMPAQASSWKDSPEIKALYEQAKKEGQVMVWGTARAEVEWIPAAFNAMFPGIEVQFLGDNDIATKAIAEARAGRHTIDVYWSSLTASLPVVQRDLIGVTDWAPFGIAKANLGFDGRMALTSNIAYAFAYNTEHVKKEDLIKDWSEATNPKYKSKMTASLFLLPRMIGGLSLAWGRDKAAQFARDLMANSDLLLTRAPREPMLQSGERLYGLGEVDSLVRQWTRSGMKIDHVIPQPVVLGQFGSMVMAKAPHPAAAKLLAGFMASPEGKKAKEIATSQTDYGPNGTSDLAKQIHSGKVQVVFDTLDNMTQREAAIREFGPIIAGQR
jgi:iron(III) transport system substrate-binding protein